MMFVEDKGQSFLIRNRKIKITNTQTMKNIMTSIKVQIACNSKREKYKTLRFSALNELVIAIQNLV